MTASAIFTAAHLAAKVADAAVTYRTRFVTALRAAWAAAKQVISTIMTKEEAFAPFTKEEADLTNEQNWYRIGYAPSSSKPGEWISLELRTASRINKAYKAGTLAAEFPFNYRSMNEMLRGDYQRLRASLLANASKYAEFISEEAAAELLAQVNAGTRPRFVAANKEY